MLWSLDKKLPRQSLLKDGKIDEGETAKDANAAYLDSLGWVLYKKKQYDEAKKAPAGDAAKDDEEGSPHGNLRPPRRCLTSPSAIRNSRSKLG